jgi:hypothetical protein
MEDYVKKSMSPGGNRGRMTHGQGFYFAMPPAMRQCPEISQ